MLLLLLLPSPQEDNAGMTHSGGAGLLPFEPCVESIPKRMNTSEQVTNIDKRIRTMIIHVRPRKFPHQFDQKKVSPFLPFSSRIPCIIIYSE